VSVLFKDHPDLLRDFTYFLPDAVHDTVRVPLTREEGERGAECVCPLLSALTALPSCVCVGWGFKFASLHTLARRRGVQARERLVRGAEAARAADSRTRAGECLTSCVVATRAHTTAAPTPPLRF